MSDLDAPCSTRAEEISSDAERVTAAQLRRVTAARRRRADPIGLITLDNGEDHTRPNTFGPARCWRSTPPSTRRSPTNGRRDRRDRQAVHPGRRRRPHLHPGRWPRRRTHRRRARPRRLPQAGRGRQAVLRLHQRPRPRRRPRGRAALHLPHRDGLRAGARPARGHARPGARLGRRLPRAATCSAPTRPSRWSSRTRSTTARRWAAGGLRVRAGRRGLRRGRLPRAVAALGRPTCWPAKSSSSGPRSTGRRPGTPPSRAPRASSQAKTGGASPAAAEGRRAHRRRA